MQSPCSARNPSSSAKLGASAAPMVGATSSELASTIERLRPIRSESGPQTQAPHASASTTTEIVSPASAGLTWNARPSCGRIACVEYVTANMPAAPSRNPAIPPAPSRRVEISRTDEQAPVDGSSLEEAEPVEPELRVLEHHQLRRRRVEHCLDLVRGVRACSGDP